MIAKDFINYLGYRKIVLEVANQSRANQWTGFDMIGTSVMKELTILMCF